MQHADDELWYEWDNWAILYLSRSKVPAEPIHHETLGLFERFVSTIVNRVS